VKRLLWISVGTLGVFLIIYQLTHNGESAANLTALFCGVCFTITALTAINGMTASVSDTLKILNFSFIAFATLAATFATVAFGAVFQILAEVTTIDFILAFTGGLGAGIMAHKSLLGICVTKKRWITVVIFFSIIWGGMAVRVFLL